MNPWDWVGPVAAATGIALVIRGVRGLRAIRRWRLAELADLSRDDVDPDWPDVRQTLGTPEPPRK